MSPGFCHSLQTTESPEEVWARVERFAQQGQGLRREPLTLLAWEFPSRFSTRRFEAHLAPTELGCYLRLQMEFQGALGWCFRLTRSRRYQEELIATARRLAGGTSGC